MSWSTKRFVVVFFNYLFISFLHTCIFPACSFRPRTYVAQGYVNRVLTETHTHSCLLVECFLGFVWVYIEATLPLPFFQSISILSVLTLKLSLIFNMLYYVFIVLPWVDVIMCEYNVFQA